MFGLKKTLITATNNALQSAFGRALYMTFRSGLTCYPHGSVHGFTGIFWKKRCLGTCGVSMTGLRATLHVRSDNISPPLATIAGMDDVDLWPPSSPYLTEKFFFLWSHIKALVYSSPVDSEEDFIARIIRAAATINVNLCFFGIACISRLVAMHLNICFKLSKNIFFLQNISVNLLGFQP